MPWRTEKVDHPREVSQGVAAKMIAELVGVSLDEVGHGEHQNGLESGRPGIASRSARSKAS